MSFSAEWLDLRAAADARARDAGLARRCAAALARRGTVRVLDLGAGTGANLRALAPALPGEQHWRLVDNDPDLLASVVPPPGVEVTRLLADLSGELRDLFDPVPALVTASAFFDLCGPGIAARIVDETVRAGAVFYTVLTYDGREVWAPPRPDDAAVLAAFHADQRRDKGLGPALGPDAAGWLSDAFRAAGYAVATARSDWILERPRDSALIGALARGSAAAAGPVADDWGAARETADRVVIGYLDLLAVPGG